MTLEEDREGNVLKHWVVSVALGFECSMKAGAVSVEMDSGFLQSAVLGILSPQPAYTSAVLGPGNERHHAGILHRVAEVVLGGMVKRSLCRARRPRPSKPLAVLD